MLNQENILPDLRHFNGGGGANPTEAESKLLEKINEKMKTELESRGFQNKADVETAMKAYLGDLKLEALRKLDDNSVELIGKITNIASEIDKIKNVRLGKGATKEEKQYLRRSMKKMFEAAEGKTSEIEMLFRSKVKGEVKLNIRAAATMTLSNTIDENDYPQDMIESMNVIDGVTKIRRGTQYIFDFATVTTYAEIEEYTTWLEEGDEQGAFAVVTEGSVKPLVSGALVRNFAKAKKVAAKKVFTEEFAKFRKKAYNIINELLALKLLRDYAAILTVDLQAQAASYVGTSLDGQFASPNDYDAIGAVAAQIETLNFAPDMIVIHPQDKWRLSLLKDTVGQYYMMIPMYSPDGLVRMMGFRVITSTYQTIGSFTLGEAGLFQIEQETLTVRMGYGIDVTTAAVGANNAVVVTAVTSDVDTNRFRIIVETFFKDYIATNNLGSLVTATFATVKAALQAA